MKRAKDRTTGIARQVAAEKQTATCKTCGKRRCAGCHQTPAPRPDELVRQALALRTAPGPRGDHMVEPFELMSRQPVSDGDDAEWHAHAVETYGLAAACIRAERDRKLAALAMVDTLCAEIDSLLRTIEEIRSGCLASYAPCDRLLKSAPKPRDLTQENTP